MSDSNPMKPPKALLDAVHRDCAPVRPLRHPWQRALIVGVWCAGILLAVPFMPGLGVRADGHALGTFVLWGPCILQTLVGLGFVHLALREAVPGLGLPRRILVAAVSGAFALQFSVAFVTWRLGPERLFDPGHFWSGTVCARSEALLGLPALFITLLLVLRAFPVRPDRAGMLGGLGAGLFADGIQHLKCAMSDPRHVLVWHLGGMVGLAVLGWLAGRGISWWRERRS